MRLLRLELRRGSGGRGRFEGGDGVEKHLRFLTDVHAAFVGDRQESGPWGLAGGASGAPGRLWMRPPGARAWSRLAGQWSGRLQAGSELAIETPGGGGYGSSRDRRG